MRTPSWRAADPVRGDRPGAGARREPSVRLVRMALHHSPFTHSRFLIPGSLMLQSERVSPLRSRAAALLAVACSLLVLTGCGYTMRGKVVEGEVTYIAIVDANDPRLEGRGVGGVNISLETDPDRLSREQVGRTVSQQDGSFSMDVDAFGAGFLQYDVGITAHRRGFETATNLFRLPSSGKRILIMMAPGVGDESWRRPESPFEQYERFR